MDRLVSTEWLAGELGADDLVVLDASKHLPATGRDAQAEFMAGHIPGARFLDLAQLADPQSTIGVTFPGPEQVSNTLAEAGVARDKRIVLYDDSDIRSAARAWFILRGYGFDKVALLDGGLARWRAEGRPLERGEAVFVPEKGESVELATSVRRKADMLANLAHGEEQVVDARDADRFAGVESSGSDGHIPGAANVHFARLFDSDGTWKDPEAIRAEFEAAGVDLDRPVTTSCNSGMTACVLLFGLALAGKDDAALYDGSWMEWGADPATPKEKGAAT